MSEIKFQTNTKEQAQLLLLHVEPRTSEKKEFNYGMISSFFGTLNDKCPYGIRLWYDIFFQLQLGLHSVAVVQYTFTHKQYI